MEHFSHDVFALDAMSEAVELGGQILAAGPHEHVLCSWMQFREWHMKLQCVKEQGPNLRSLCKSEVCTRRKKFESKSAPLHYTRALDTYEKHRQLKEFSHTIVVEIAVHLCPVGLSWMLMSFEVVYKVCIWSPCLTNGWKTRWVLLLVFDKKRQSVTSSFQSPGTTRNCDQSRRVWITTG